MRWAIYAMDSPWQRIAASTDDGDAERRIGFPTHTKMTIRRPRRVGSEWTVPIQTHNFHDSGDQDWACFYSTAGEIVTLETQNLGSGFGHLSGTLPG